MRRVGVVSSARSDYFILKPVLDEIRERPDLRLTLYITGMHLDSEYGCTAATVRADGYPDIREVASFVTSGGPAGPALSMGKGLTAFAEAFANDAPDILLVLGDRYDMFPAAPAALFYKIPLAHVHGGELTFGALDDSLRHALTKLSHLHFASTDAYAGRIRQMGEEAWRVTVTGAPGLDNFSRAGPMTRDSFCTTYGDALAEPFILVTYHTETVHYEDSAAHLEQLLEAVDRSSMPALFTMANSDTEGRSINRRLRQYCRDHGRCVFVENLGLDGYVSAMRYAACMLGNSSSGIIEAPSFALPVINIGDRQKGRVRAGNVIDVPCDNRAIEKALQKALAPGFRRSLEDLQNPYGDGRAAARIVDVMARVPIDNRLLEKRFNDL